MLLQNRYEYEPSVDWIADGSASRVYKATDIQHKRPVVLKFYHHLGDLSPALFKANMQKTASFAHDNLVQLYDYFEIENINPIGQLDYIRIGVWEYVDRAPAQADATESLLRQATKAIHYLEQQQCSHGSLGIDNVFVTPDQQLKLNNAGVFRYENSTASQDVTALGLVLRQHLANEQNELHQDTREVYRVIIDRAANEQLTQANDIDTLLDTYERNKRFDAVLPLTKEQFESRYNLQGIADSSDEHTTYQATDKLADCDLQLVVYHDTPSAKQYNDLRQQAFAHWFKVDFGDKVCLVAVQSETIAPEMPLAQSKDELAHTATVPTAALAALIFTETTDTTADPIEDSNDTATIEDEMAAETNEPTTDEQTTNSDDDDVAAIPTAAADNDSEEEEVVTHHESFRDETNTTSQEQTTEQTDDDDHDSLPIVTHSDDAAPVATQEDQIDDNPDDDQAATLDQEDNDFWQTTATNQTSADEDLKSTEVVRNEAIAQVIKEENELDDLIDNFQQHDADDANLKPTEIVRGEAMEQVRRDIERLLSGEKNDNDQL